MADMSHAGIEHFDPRQQEFLRRVVDAVNNVGKQANVAPVGQIDPPPAHASATVSGAGGMLSVQIAAPSPQWRGAHNFVDVSTDASFSKFETVSNGPSTSIRHPLSAGTYYTRSYSQYSTSGTSDMLYHGPTTVTAGIAPAIGDNKVGFGANPYTTQRPPTR